MAIYRPPKSRWPLAIGIGVVALVLGLIAGVVLSRGQQDPADGADEIQSQLLGAAGSVEVAAIEYEEAVEGGEVVNQAEYSGAQDALESSRDRYMQVRDALEGLASERVAELDAAFEEAGSLMSDAADPDDVTPQLEELEALLKGTAP